MKEQVAGLYAQRLAEQFYAYAGFPRALNATNAFDAEVAGNHNRNAKVGADMTNRTSGY
ncbi:MAG: hypothetical protein WA957_11750 [Alteraurantiacibacter sp.]